MYQIRWTIQYLQHGQLKHVLVEMYSYHFLFFSFSSYITTFFFLNLSCTIMIVQWLLQCCACISMCCLQQQSRQWTMNKNYACQNTLYNMQIWGVKIIAVIQVQWYAFNILECCSIYWNEYLLKYDIHMSFPKFVYQHNDMEIFT